MKKRKTIKIASITIGIVIVGMFLFAMPLLGADKSSDAIQAPVQAPSVNTTATEEATVSNDADDVQEEVVGENEANDIEEANESGDLKEADENLPGGGYADPEGVEADHEFEGVE
jgi:hypothetical protein